MEWVGRWWGGGGGEEAVLLTASEDGTIKVTRLRVDNGLMDF